VAQKVAEVLKEATDTDLLIREQTTGLLKLQNQVSERGKVLANIRKQVEQARAELGQELFGLDSPPLWKALFSAGSPALVDHGTRESGSRILTGQRNSLRIQKSSLFHAVLFLAAIAVLYIVRRALTPETAAKEFSSAFQILARPFSSAFLFVLL
jgi:hypothetical protein